MTVKFVAVACFLVYQVSAQCCGPRPVQVQAQPIVTPYNQVVTQNVPNVVTSVQPQYVTNVPSQIVTNLPSPVINTQILGYNQVIPNCVNPVVPSAVFATNPVDNSVANSLANALQLLIVSDLIESTLNIKECPTVIETFNMCQELSYPQLVATDLCGCNSCNYNPCNSCNQVYVDVVSPLPAQLTLGYNLPVVSVSVDPGCGCNGYCGCATPKYFI